MQQIKIVEMLVNSHIDFVDTNHFHRRFLARFGPGWHNYLRYYFFKIYHIECSDILFLGFQCALRNKSKCIDRSWAATKHLQKTKL